VRKKLYITYVLAVQYMIGNIHWWDDVESLFSFGQFLAGYCR